MFLNKVFPMRKTKKNFQWERLISLMWTNPNVLQDEEKNFIFVNLFRQTGIVNMKCDLAMALSFFCSHKTQMKIAISEGLYQFLALIYPKDINVRSFNVQRSNAQIQNLIDTLMTSKNWQSSLKVFPTLVPKDLVETFLKITTVDNQYGY